MLQTPDTELNQRVRNKYQEQESQLLAERMRLGAATPSLTPQECMWLMLNVLKDEKLHVDASKGFKSTGATVDLWGSEDALIAKEARAFLVRGST